MSMSTRLFPKVTALRMEFRANLETVKGRESSLSDAHLGSAAYAQRAALLARAMGNAAATAERLAEAAKEAMRS